MNYRISRYIGSRESGHSGAYYNDKMHQQRAGFKLARPFYIPISTHVATTAASVTGGLHSAAWASVVTPEETSATGGIVDAALGAVAPAVEGLSAASAGVEESALPEALKSGVRTVTDTAKERP